MPEAEAQAFLPKAQAALAAFAARPGYVRGRVGRAADDPTAWVLTTEWDSVGSYRRSLSSYEVKVVATTLLAESRDEPSAFEVLHEVNQGQPSAPRPSDRAGLGRAVDR